MQLAPIITRTEPLPPEIIQAADTASHRAGDMLMRASGLTLALRRPQPLEPDLLPSLVALAEEGRLFAAAITTIGERIAALQARGTT
jgi:hypothetical protein